MEEALLKYSCNNFERVHFGLHSEFETTFDAHSIFCSTQTAIQNKSHFRKGNQKSSMKIKTAKRNLTPDLDYVDLQWILVFSSFHSFHNQIIAVAS